MKKYLQLLFVALIAVMSLSLTSCSKDDEPSGGDIIGTWKMDSVFGDLGVTEYIKFNKDGSCITVNIDDGSLTGNQRVDVVNGEWSRSGDSLFVDDYEYTILKLDSKKMVINVMGITTTFVKVPDSEIEKYLK